jgi:hypothetical protein
MSTRLVQLYCPEYDVTVDDFMITPSMNDGDFALSASTALRTHDVLLEKVWPCDVNAERLSVDEIPHGERILIAVDGDEALRPEPKLEVALYLEDDSLEKPLRVRTPTVSSSRLCPSNPPTRNSPARPAAPTSAPSAAPTPSPARTSCA